jgi:hypothetical protein
VIKSWAVLLTRKCWRYFHLSSKHDVLSMILAKEKLMHFVCIFSCINHSCFLGGDN